MHPSHSEVEILASLRTITLCSLLPIIARAVEAGKSAVVVYPAVTCSTPVEFRVPMENSVERAEGSVNIVSAGVPITGNVC